jgi:ABC-type transport system involved in multi-copper enzyme maturation permease subunit
MTTTFASRRIAVPERAHDKTAFIHLMQSEWTKVRTVRSTLWSLVLLFVLTLGFTGLITGLTVGQWNTADASDRLSIMADPVNFILGAGFQLSQLTICVLGVLVISGEYGTGMIRSSLLAVPKRTSMFAAKCLVFTVFVFVVALAVAFPSFFMGAAILHDHVAVGIGDPGVLRAVLGAGLYLAVLGLFALAIGALVRHSGGGITGVIGFVLVLAPLTQLLPGSLGKHIHAYLPSEAGQQIVRTHQASDELLSPWQGFGVFCLWTALLLLLAGYLLERRDA